MHPRLSILAFATLVFLVALSAAAEGKTESKLDPSFRKTVSQYLKIQGVETTLGDQMTYAVADQMLGAVAGGGIEITQAIQDIVLSESRKQIGSHFSDIEFLTDLYAPIYAEHFTEKEMQQLIDFLNSPVGKKTIDLTPTLAQATQFALSTAADALIPVLQQNVEARLTAAGLAPGQVPPEQ